MRGICVPCWNKKTCWIMSWKTSWTAILSEVCLKIFPIWGTARLLVEGGDRCEASRVGWSTGGDCLPNPFATLFVQILSQRSGNKYINTLHILTVTCTVKICTQHPIVWYMHETWCPKVRFQHRALWRCRGRACSAAGLVQQLIPSWTSDTRTGVSWCQPMWKAKKSWDTFRITT